MVSKEGSLAYKLSDGSGYGFALGRQSKYYFNKWWGFSIECHWKPATSEQENKVFEEYNELLEAKKSGDIEEIKKELADVIITMIVLDKLRGSNPKSWIYFVDKFEDGGLFNLNFQNSVYTYFIYSLTNTATRYNLNVWECLEHKYNIVAKREGEVVNGTFVKN